MWLEEPQFVELIREWRQSFNIGRARFRQAIKLKKLKEKKNKIKEWVKGHFGEMNASKAAILEEL